MLDRLVDKAARALKHTSKGIAASILAVGLLSANPADARPRRVAQNHTQNNAQLSEYESRTHELVKNEIIRKDLPLEIAPYVMAVIKKETKFRRRHSSDAAFQDRIDKLLENIESFNGLICVNNGKVNVLDLDDAIGYGLITYSLNGKSKDLITKNCARYEGPEDFARRQKNSSSLAKGIQMYHKIKALAKSYEIRMGTHELAGKQDKIPTPKSEMDILADVPITKPAKNTITNKKPPEPKPLVAKVDEIKPEPEQIQIKTEPVAKAEQKIEIEKKEPEKKKADEPKEKEPDSLEAKVKKVDHAKKNGKVRVRRCREPNYSTIDGRLYLKVKVRQNESPWSLADKYTRNGTNHTRIRRYNGAKIDESNPLQPGEKVYIPKNLLKWEYRKKKCYYLNHNSKKRRSKKGRKYSSMRVRKRRR